jgi:ATP-dependent protease ClpP protease subunit
MKKIILEGEFGWEINVNNIRPQLEAAKGDDLDVYLASPGGSVFKGIHVFNLFRDYKRDYPESQNTLTIKGLAASMSSYLMMCPAFDMVVVEDNAIFMMHNPYGGVIGDYREVESFYKMIEGLTDMMAQAYAKKLKKSKKEIRKLLDEEHWAFGENIVKQGFADEVLKTDGDKDSDNAYAMAKITIKELEQKLRQEEIKSEEFQAIAALLTADVYKQAAEDINNDHTPADDAGEINTGGVIMTLEELKAQHPALYESIFNLGKEAGVKEMKDKAEKISPFLSNPDYPKNISEAAISVFKGEKSIEILDTMVATADMIKEQFKTVTAVVETPPDTPGSDSNGQLSKEYLEDGTIMNEHDMIAETNRINQMNNPEVQ